MGALDKLESIGVLGILAAAGYLVWSNWSKISGFFQNPLGDLGGYCPAGSYDVGNNLCCPVGQELKYGKCVIPIEPDYSGDKPGTCTSPQVWDPIFKTCVTPQTQMIQCWDGLWHYPPCPVQPTEPVHSKYCASDGSYVLPTESCPVYNLPNVDYWSCTCAAAVMNIKKSEAERLNLHSCGEVCDYFPGSGGSGNNPGSGVGIPSDVSIVKSIPCRTDSNYIGATNCWGTEQTCATVGATIPDPVVSGVWYNDIAWDRRSCFLNARV